MDRKLHVDVDHNHPKDRVSVTIVQYDSGDWNGQSKIHLTIGRRMQGQSRYSVLSLHEARPVAHTLLLMAERADRPEIQPD